jgi:hypothetical protein
LRLEIVHLAGEDRLNDTGIDRLRSDFERRLESTREMLADPQRRLELGREQRGGLVGDNVPGATCSSSEALSTQSI